MKNEKRKMKNRRMKCHPSPRPSPPRTGERGYTLGGLVQIGLSQIVMGNLPLADLFAQAKQAGYDALELVLKNEGELTPKTPPEELKQIAKRAADAGLKLIALVHGQMTGNLLGVGEQRKLGVEQTAEGLRVAKELGMDCTLHTLGRLSP